MRFILILLSLMALCNYGVAQTVSQDLRQTYGELFLPEKPSIQKYSKNLIPLGEKIFFDERFSETKAMSCATCHNPQKAFTDGRKTALGKNGKALKRKTMTLYNIGDDPFFFWDGRVQTLEEQFFEALTNIEEMAFSPEEMLNLMKQDKNYMALFQKNKLTLSKDNIAKAVAAYISSLNAPKTRFDTWLAGNDKALSQAELRGFEIFNNKADCTACHFGADFTDNIFNDIGLADKDMGRGHITGKARDNHFFKTSGLRAIKDRSPYMHNGIFATLEQVIDHYDNDQFKRAETDIPPTEKQGETIAFHAFSQPLNLTKQEKQDLIAFLKSL